MVAVSMTGDDLQTRLVPLTTFMGASPLTAAIARLENTLAGCRTEDISALLEERGVSNRLLRAAFYARAEFGRITT